MLVNQQLNVIKTKDYCVGLLFYLEQKFRVGCVSVIAVPFRIDIP